MNTRTATHNSTLTRVKKSACFYQFYPQSIVWTGKKLLTGDGKIRVIDDIRQKENSFNIITFVERL